MFRAPQLPHGPRDVRRAPANELRIVARRCAAVVQCMEAGSAAPGGSCRRVALSARRSSSSRRACSTRLVPGFDDTGPIIDGDGSSDGPGQSVRVSIHRPLGLAAPALLVVRVRSAPLADRRRRRRQRRPQTKRAGLDPPTSGSSAAGASLTTPFLIFAADRDAERGVARWPVLIIALRG